MYRCWLVMEIDIVFFLNSDRVVRYKGSQLNTHKKKIYIENAFLFSSYNFVQNVCPKC